MSNNDTVRDKFACFIFAVTYSNRRHIDIKSIKVDSATDYRHGKFDHGKITDEVDGANFYQSRSQKRWHFVKIICMKYNAI